jgi:DNA-binding NarL/FixJ family response regulator
VLALSALVTVRIAVVDPLPMFQQGIAGALEASGHAVETPADVMAWAHQGVATLVLLTLMSERDWELLSRLCAGATSPLVIAVLGNESAALAARALRAGARSVLPRTVAAVTLRRTVEATIDGQAVMPAGVVAVLGEPDTVAERGPSGNQLSWLRQLANGATVAQLADRAGYSERAMFRLLGSLYRQMGVRTRLQAIMRAQEAGLL